jgi:glycosyltransferase involved in cell wall biosynthesis
VKVAIVHDDLTQRGGAERVVVSLARLFPDAPILTAAYDRDGTFPELAERRIRTSFLQALPHRGQAARALLPLYPAAFATLRPRGFDLIVSSSSRFAHGIGTDGIPHLAYCHNPPRFLYQEGDYFGEGSPAPRWARPLLAPVLAGLRRWDARAGQRPDRYLANSQVVAGRIEKVYGRQAHVVHPPVDLDRFAGPVDDSRVPSEPYYLVVSRLLGYKRVDLAAAACRQRGHRLVVVGDGPARARVEAAAGPGCELRGRVDEPELRALLAHCRAVIHPGEEDFGFMPIEANAAGRPVVTVASGGALETVVDGMTGVLFRGDRPEDLNAALDRLESRSWDADALRTHAQRFSEPRFHRAVLDHARALLEG